MPVKFDPKNKDVLLSAERRRTLDMYRLLSLIPIVPHQSVVDIGCGPGFFTVPLAKYLWGGKVYAVDVQQEMLDAAKKAVESERLSNVEFLKSTERRLPLEKESVDGALLAFVLQEADSHTSLLKETRRSVRSSGWLAILEWHRKESDSGPPLEQRIEDDEMAELVTDAGFRVVSKRDLNEMQYLVLASR